MVFDCGYAALCSSVFLAGVACHHAVALRCFPAGLFRIAKTFPPSRAAIAASRSLPISIVNKQPFRPQTFFRSPPNFALAAKSRRLLTRGRQRVFYQPPENNHLRIYKTRANASCAHPRKPIHAMHYRRLRGAARGRVLYQSDAFYLQKLRRNKNTKTADRR